jgi:hypothetical protein
VPLGRGRVRLIEGEARGVQRLAVHEIDHYVMDKRYVRSDGEEAWIRLHASGVWDDAGVFVTFIAQIVDIDVQKRLIAELQCSNDDLQHCAYVRRKRDRDRPRTGPKDRATTRRSGSAGQ